MMTPETRSATPTDVAFGLRLRAPRSARRALHLAAAFMLALIVMTPAPVSAAAKVGQVVLSRGVVTAHVEQQPLRLLGRNAPLYVGDIISTGPASFAVLDLEDGGRMSLRPNTVFTVKEYRRDESSGSLLMNLFKGGLRMLSGLISKNNPDGVKITAAGATIGIRGTEFDARICDNDCQGGGARSAATTLPTRSLVVGRVALMRGTMSATGVNDVKRNMTRGAPLHEGDTLETGRGSYAVLIMRDRGRITLKPGTRFRIDKYREPPTPEASSSLFGAALSLLKGGVRVLTGLIGKNAPDSVTVSTSQATIGIRGTGFDIDDLGPCGSGGPCGLHASVWLGTITMRNDKGTWIIETNVNAQLAGRDAVLVFVSQAPVFDVPRPDQVDIDFDEFFKTSQLSDPGVGVYLSCYEGHCRLSKGEQTVDLGAGESAYAPSEGTTVVRFDIVQPFQVNDSYLEKINGDSGALNELSNPDVGSQSEFECTL